MSEEDRFLGILCEEQIPVFIYLTNGIKIQGKIEAFDQHVIVLHGSVSQLVYKRSISTIVPPKEYAEQVGKDRGAPR